MHEKENAVEQKEGQPPTSTGDSMEMDDDDDDAVEITLQNRENALKSEQKQQEGDEVERESTSLDTTATMVDNTEEDDLLQCDDEDDDEEAITKEIEDELLKSDDDDVAVQAEPRESTETIDSVESKSKHSNEMELQDAVVDAVKDICMINDGEGSNEQEAINSHTPNGKAEQSNGTTSTTESGTPESQDTTNLTDDDSSPTEEEKTTSNKAAPSPTSVWRADVVTEKDDNSMQQGRLLTGFQGEDSSQESRGSLFPLSRDDRDEELSNDMFPSMERKDDSHSRDATTTSDTLQSTVSSQSEERREEEVATPKLNGDHKLNEETDEQITNHQDVIEDSYELSNKYKQHLILSESHQQSADCSNSTSTFNTADIEMPLAPLNLALPPQVDDDDASRGSSPAASWEHRSMGSSSSVHQLVIDHPLEDLEPPAAVLPPPPMITEERIAPLKITLKRRLSDAVSEPLPVKRPFVDDETAATQPENHTESDFEATQQENHKQDSPAQWQLSGIGSTPSACSELNMATSTPNNSLLLQHLQRPYTPPPPPPSSLSMLFSAPYKLPPASMPSPISSQRTPSVTKFLCFKCKIGSYDTLAALNEHQQTCLSGMSLLPPPLPPPPAPPATNNMPVPPPPSAQYDSAIEPKSTMSVASESLVPQQAPEKERIYKCSKCSTFHDSSHFFLHMREQHQRYLCLYCARSFTTAEKLSLHLEIKHDLEQNHYNSEEALRLDAAGDDGRQVVLFLLCCSCQHVFVDSEQFSDHLCAEYIEPCALCGQKGRHSNDCRAHPSKAKQLAVQPTKLGAQKKKSKERVIPAKLATPSQSSYHSVQSLSQSASTSTFCDKPNRKSRVSTPTITAASTLASAAFQTQQYQQQQQDSSDNMITDEPYNYGEASTATAMKNPYQELGEREILEQQQQAACALPPDRMADGQVTGMTDEDRVPPLRLVVPKLKLCVPKEFQKSVDAALSSTDCEDEDDDDEAEEEADEEDDGNVAQQMPMTMDADAPNGEENNSSQTAASAAEEDDTYDDSQSNLMMRMLQAEIERTKLDIQRERESLHSKKRTVSGGSEVTTAMAQQKEAIITAERDGNGNWSPTPPASPQARPPQYEGLAPPPEQQLQSGFLPPLESQPERRATIGSDIMDIDETITSDQAQIIAQSEPERNEHNDSAVSPETAGAENSELANESVEIPDPNLGEPQLSNEIFQQGSNDLDDSVGENSAETDAAVATEQTTMEVAEVAPRLPPADGIEVAGEETQIIDLQLDRPLEKYEIVEFVRICLEAVYRLCLYCNHARRIAVNGHSLVLHMIAEHRFSATVDSITAEELLPDTIVNKLKSYLPSLELEFFNSSTYCTMGDSGHTSLVEERVFECFSCRFSTTTHKELYLHNRKMHLRSAILCFMCRANFYNFSEVLCHICPGAPNKTPVFDVRYRCCLCEVTDLPSPFRLMVHLRKRHGACDVCLEDCKDQSRLSSHVWKHKQHHVCYRCGIAYRNKQDITKHLFWKHGTESTICKRCLQKRWPHVYHFCVPPTTFTCDVCTLCFTRAMYLTVHKRIHTGDLRYPCTEVICEEKFISRRLLLKHVSENHPQTAVSAPPHDAADDDKGSLDEKGTAGMEIDEKQAPLVGEAADKLNEEGAAVKTELKEENEENKATVSSLAESVKQEATDGTIAACKSEATLTPHTEAAEKLKSGTPVSAERKKKKKKKRSKESLEDLNLTAPNLSESDSSGDSDTESRSKDDDDLVPNVMLSPPSEAENDFGEEIGKGLATLGAMAEKPPGQVLDIWKHLLQGQQNGSSDEEAPDQSDDDAVDRMRPADLHVAYSDHDYCNMFAAAAKKSPSKRKSGGKSPRRSIRRSAGSSSSSGASSSDTDTSCSCGTNCSCSSSGSASSSSSSSSDNSDTSGASNVSRKRHRKKSERDRARKKSQSASPMKKLRAMSESLLNVDDAEQKPNDEGDLSQNNEPLFDESDLQTAESETDEEFYDQHPQRLATEQPAQKRTELMAQTRLSPSHNYDIVENSRPSTPSLPEDFVFNETKMKQKKKKRDRKSSTRQTAAGVVPTLKLHIGQVPADVSADFPALAEPPMALQPAPHTPYTPYTPGMYGRHAPSPQILTPQAVAPHMLGRMSEGSSCSDADGSLKRSKRARRPNKFYGYTSDDESMSATLGQPLMIGMRAFKPTPPPQLTWNKDDLPTPSRVRNKQPRTPRTPGTPAMASGIAPFTSTPAIQRPPKRKRAAAMGGQITTEGKTPRKRGKRIAHQNALPPIPRLKIWPTQPGGGGNHIPHYGQNYNNSDMSGAEYNNHDEEEEEEDEEEEDESSDSSSDDEQPPMDATQLWRTALQLHTNATPSPLVIAAQPQRVVMPPTPHATVFNHKIPPALLPNPDFATLQYFKANNIRYPIRPPAGARQPRDGESVYCYCRCPYDEVSEMIACDGDNCLIEWFHFECVGIMVAPQGKWFCAECRPQYSEELYPTTTGVGVPAPLSQPPVMFGHGP